MLNRAGRVALKSTPFLYLIKSINTAIEIYSVRLRPHQNPLAADLRIPPIHFYGNAADFRSQRILGLRAQPHQNPVAPDFRIPAMLSNENAPDFRPLPPEAGNGRKSGAFSLESIAGIRKSGATGFWCGCALKEYIYMAVLILLLKQRM